jgi:multiple sugar transport system substrate-binding protein
MAATARTYRTEVRPDVRIEWTVRSLQAFADQPLDRLAETFDLIVLDHPAVGHAVARECLVALDEHVDAAFLDEQSASTVGSSHRSYEWEGHQWALAVDAAAQVAAYRPELLGEEVPPRTWAEVIALAEVRGEEAPRVAIPLIPTDAVCAFLGLCWSLGLEPCAGDRVAGPDVAREALGTLARLTRAAHPESLEWDPPWTYDRMAATDEVAYCPLGFGYSNYARPGYRPNRIRFGPAPSFGGPRPSGTLGGAGLAVSRHCRHVTEACSYAAYVASPEVQRGPYFDGGGQPGHRGAWTDDRTNHAAGGYFRDTLESLDGSYLRPRFDGFVAFQDRAGEVVHRFLRDGGDAGEAVDRMERLWRATRRAGEAA